MPQTKKKRTSRIPDAPDSVPKRIKTFDLQLTSEELLHVRDMMSVILPPDGSVRLSESLAVSEKRQLSESKLWAKIVALCIEAELPVGDEAPDFFVGMTGPLALSVFQLDKNVDPNEDEE